MLLGKRAISNRTSKNEEAGPKQELLLEVQLWMCLVVKVKVNAVKKKYIYCIGTWNVRSTN